MDINPIIEDLNPWWREPAARLPSFRTVRRRLQSQVLDRVRQRGDRRALLILGPRQVGKSTLLAQVAFDLLRADPPIAKLPAANLTYFDFADDRLPRGEEISARDVVNVRPRGFDEKFPRVFLLDEISRSHNWDLWLKGAVDRGEGRIVATDSAASVLREGGQESGQGRWDELWLDGLTLDEFARLNGDDEAADPDLVERYLALGGFPEHATSDDPAMVRSQLRAEIVNMAILRDLSGRVNDPLRVRDLFVYLMQESGSEFNAANRSSDLGINRRTVSDWVHLLEATFLLVRLEREAGKASARLRGRPKLYAADHGLINAFAASPVPSRDDAVRSKVFEATVFRHLRELTHGRLDAEVTYLRGSQGKEVDFLLRVGDSRIAIEVTSARQVRDDKLAKLHKATRSLSATRRFLVHGGLTDVVRDGIRLLPLPVFLLDSATALEVKG